ncbi:WD40 repeat domain-containing protein [Chloroflexi bacterium TSY]|nr:WD40 repeat domain-containing protein [Chloroflexi bacterium TSY]
MHQYKGNSPDGLIRYSPNGQKILTLNASNSLKIQDSMTGEELLTFPGHIDAVYSVSYSASGKWLITSGDLTAKIWDAESKRNIQSLSGHRETVRTAAFSPDERLIVTASQDKTAKVWNAKTSELLLTLQHTDTVAAATFNPDGTKIATASGNSDQTWTAVQGDKILTLNGHTQRINSIEFSPDNQKLVTASDDGTGIIWDASDGTDVTRLLGHSGEVVSASYNATGDRIVTASWDGTIGIWDASEGTELATLYGHSGQVYSARFSPDSNYVASSGSDSTVRLWDSSTGTQLYTFTSKNDAVLSLAFSPNGKHLVTCGESDICQIWDLTAREHLPLTYGTPNLIADKPVLNLKLSAHEAQSLDKVAMRPDGLHLLLSNTFFDTSNWVRDVESGEIVFDFEGSNAMYSPDGQAILSVVTETIQILDSNNGTGLMTINPEIPSSADIFSPIDFATYSPDGTEIMTIIGNKLQIWDATAGTEIDSYNGDVRRATYLSDLKKIALGDSNNAVRIWNRARNSDVTPLLEIDGDIQELFSGRLGMHLAIDGEGVATQIWSIEERRPLFSFNDKPRSVAFSQDEKRVVTTDGETVKIWSTLDGRELFAIYPFHGRYNFVSSGIDGPGLTWEERMSPEDFMYATFSPDDRYILTTSEHGGAKIWPSTEQGFVNIVQSLTQRFVPELTEEERQAMQIE